MRGTPPGRHKSGGSVWDPVIFPFSVPRLCLSEPSWILLGGAFLALVNERRTPCTGTSPRQAQFPTGVFSFGQPCARSGTWEMLLRSEILRLALTCKGQFARRKRGLVGKMSLSGARNTCGFASRHARTLARGPPFLGLHCVLICPVGMAMPVSWTWRGGPL